MEENKNYSDLPEEERLQNKGDAAEMPADAADAASAGEAVDAADVAEVVPELRKTVELLHNEYERAKRL